ncbi:MAG: hypothetical protein PHP62_02800 [Candidatus Moranbacteria bacterium]|nr:hypothetical protein [Candidatus Moranbacteria bacterium]
MESISIEECWLSLIFFAPLIFFFGYAIGMVRESIVDVLFESLVISLVIIVGGTVITIDIHGLDQNHLIWQIASSILALISILIGSLAAFKKKIKRSVL